MRFWQVFVATYLIPILACLVGLLCFRFLSKFAPPDPPRALRIDNSATDPNHQILFWAKFGNFSNSFDFKVREECIYMCMHPVHVSILHTYIYIHVCQHCMVMDTFSPLLSSVWSRGMVVSNTTTTSQLEMLFL